MRTKKDFIEECKNFAKAENDDWYEYSYYRKQEKQKPSYEDRFLNSWISGGTSGGSCWDTSESVYYEKVSDPEKELEGLNLFLETHFPSITFLQYKRFAKYIQTCSRTENEYYGNSTNYAGKYIWFEDVFKVLEELGMVGTMK